MEQKQHLQQLLNEEQEPFVLNNFINERRYLRKRSHPGKAYDSRSGFPTIKRSKSGENPSFSDRFCLDLRSVCLSSSIESPSSPFILFLDSEHRRHSSVSTSIRNLLETELENSSLSTRRSSNRTTESLIHSFRRSLSIKKNSSSSNLKKSSISSYNLFRSIIKRLTPSKSQSLIKIKPFTKQSSKSEFKNGDSKKFEGKGGSSGLGFYGSTNNSSAWSESDKSEIRSMDLDSNSSRSEDDGEFERVAESRTETITSSSAKLATEICSNGDDPLGNCIWQPEFQSPVASPTRLKTEVEGSYQDKEQFSPVSVLEPPFEDDGFEQSFATVQRAKRLLLDKLCRFERLAELDQLELEKRIAEEEEEGENEVEIAESLAREILNGSSCPCTCPVRAGMKKLVHDLIEEESGDHLGIDDSVKRIGQRIVDWKTVESHTIDMIVEMDLKRDDEKWRTVGDLVKETAIEIEIGIFGFLLEELSFDLSRSIGDGTAHVGHEDMGTL